VVKPRRRHDGDRENLSLNSNVNDIRSWTRRQTLEGRRERQFCTDRSSELHDQKVVGGNIERWAQGGATMAVVTHRNARAQKRRMNYDSKEGKKNPAREGDTPKDAIQFLSIPRVPCD